MLLEVPVRVDDLLHRERARHVDGEWIRADQAVEPLDGAGVNFYVVILEGDAAGRVGLRLDAVGVGDAAAVAHRGEGAVSGGAAGGHQGGVETVWRERAGGGDDVILAAVD